VLGETVYEGLSAGPAGITLLSGNPSPDGATILFRSGATGPSELSLFDAAGRRIRTLYREAGGGPHGGIVIWNGRDELGRRVPSGLYWIRLLAGQQTETTRLSLIR
jgi:hypothetical protein